VPFPRQVPNIPRESEYHELRTDVVYAEVDGFALRFDHYRARKVDGPAPAVVVVHGGAWMHGDPSQAAGNALHFARRGIATVLDLVPARARAIASPRRSTTSGAGLRWVRAHADGARDRRGRLALLGPVGRARISR
jgi:acetyl esterase/lipase